MGFPPGSRSQSRSRCAAAAAALLPQSARRAPEVYSNGVSPALLTGLSVRTTQARVYGRPTGADLELSSAEILQASRRLYPSTAFDCSIRNDRGGPYERLARSVEISDICTDAACPLPVALAQMLRGKAAEHAARAEFAAGGGE